MRVVFCWWTFQGYFAACWKALARRDDIELSVLAAQLNARSGVDSAGSGAFAEYGIQEVSAINDRSASVDFIGDLR